MPNNTKTIAPVSIETAWKRLPSVGLNERFPAKASKPTSNLHRQVKAKQALTLANYVDPMDPRSAIVDCITDFRHLCDALGLSFDDVSGSSKMHYDEEACESADTD